MGSGGLGDDSDYGDFGTGEPAPWSAQGRVKAAVEVRRGTIGLVREGRWAEATAAVAESVAQLRAVAATDPQAAEPELGKSLAALAGFQGVQGHADQRLALTMEAAPLLRHGTAVDPARYIAALTLDLFLMADTLRQLKRYGEATDAALEALACARRPDFAPDPSVAAAIQDPELAASLAELLAYQCRMVLFSVYTACDQPGEALEGARLLAARSPRRFTGTLARHLNILAELYAKRRETAPAAGYRREALPQWREAIGYARAELAEKARDGGARVRLVQALLGYATQLTALSRPEQALAPSREAADLARSLARDDPARFQASFERCQKILAALERRLHDVE